LQMRLTVAQINMIRNTIWKILGSASLIWLFGSRVDDTRRGGDVDIYVEPGQEKQLMSILKCKVALEEGLDLHVDLIVKESGKEKPIYQLAKSQGVQL